MKRQMLKNLVIRFGDTSEAVPLVDFHVAWSKEMLAISTW